MQNAFHPRMCWLLKKLCTYCKHRAFSTVHRYPIATSRCYLHCSSITIKLLLWVLIWLTRPTKSIAFFLFHSIISRLEIKYVAKKSTTNRNSWNLIFSFSFSLCIVCVIIKDLHFLKSWFCQDNYFVDQHQWTQLFHLTQFLYICIQHHKRCQIRIITLKPYLPLLFNTA